MTIAEKPKISQEPGHVFFIRHASWELYEQMLREFENQHIRITYDQGRMVLMSPLPIHDKIKKMAARLIEQATLELDMPVSSFGSTTWKRRDLAKGLEADECYYIQSEPLVHGRTDIDLARDPAPDLAVEIDITHNPLNRNSIYAALGVGEIWRFDGESFSFHRRVSEGGYERIEASGALPFMTPAIVEQFVQLVLQDENAGLRSFVQWLRGLDL